MPPAPRVAVLGYGNQGAAQAHCLRVSGWQVRVGARAGRGAERARAHGLFAGLAGSLALDDVPVLLALAPDLLGFRTALTTGGRSGALDPAAVAALRAAIPPAQLPAALAASNATAAAGAARAAASRTAGSASISAPKSL